MAVGGMWSGSPVGGGSQSSPGWGYSPTNRPQSNPYDLVANVASYRPTQLFPGGNPGGPLAYGAQPPTTLSNPAPTPQAPTPDPGAADQGLLVANSLAQLLNPQQAPQSSSVDWMSILLIGAVIFVVFLMLR